LAVFAAVGCKGDLSLSFSTEVFPMGWYVESDNEVTGPLDEESVAAAIRSGALRSESRICAVGERTWRNLVTHQPFAEALKRTAPTIRPSRP
jgi:hypothetical protein